MQDVDKFRRGRSVVYSLSAHLVFVTKYRRGVIPDRVRDHLKTTFTLVMNDFGSELVEMDGADDHIHLLVSFPPKCLINGLALSPSRQGREVATHEAHNLGTPVQIRPLLPQARRPTAGQRSPKPSMGVQIPPCLPLWSAGTADHASRESERCRKAPFPGLFSRRSHRYSAWDQRAGVLRVQSQVEKTAVKGVYAGKRSWRSRRQNFFPNQSPGWAGQ